VIRLVHLYCQSACYIHAASQDYCLYVLDDCGAKEMQVARMLSIVDDNSSETSSRFSSLSSRPWTGTWAIANAYRCRLFGPEPHWARTASRMHPDCNLRAQTGIYASFRRHLTSMAGGDRPWGCEQWGEIRPGPVKMAANCHPLILPAISKSNSSTMASSSDLEANLFPRLTRPAWKTK
jgi:hypothetical protein